MNKRYQIFVSSTFEDLKEERQTLLRTILELNHIPAGMELFPAVDDEAWELIKEVIDESDYYVLVIGGRYGSQSEEGISFTEKEYDYAISKKKYVIALLHENPDNLPRGKTETNTATWKKLKSFRKKVEKKHTCKFWDGTKDLGSKVILSLTAEIRRHPAIGWVRANDVTNPEVVNEISRLSSENAELRKMLEQTMAKLKHIDTVDKIIKLLKNNTVKFSVFYHKDSDWTEEDRVSLYNIFSRIAPHLMIEFSTEDAAYYIGYSLRKNKSEDIRDQWPVPSNHVQSWLSDLAALDLLTASTQKHSLKDKSQYWTLTEWGRKAYSTIRKKRLEKGIPTEIPKESDAEGAK